jgi:hypothetical protein
VIIVNESAKNDIQVANAMKREDGIEIGATEGENDVEMMIVDVVAIERLSRRGEEVARVERRDEEAQHRQHRRRKNLHLILLIFSPFWSVRGG